MYTRASVPDSVCLYPDGRYLDGLYGLQTSGRRVRKQVCRTSLVQGFLRNYDQRRREVQRNGTSKRIQHTVHQLLRPDLRYSGSDHDRDLLQRAEGQGIQESNAVGDVLPLLPFMGCSRSHHLRFLLEQLRHHQPCDHTDGRRKDPLVCGAQVLESDHHYSGCLEMVRI